MFQSAKDTMQWLSDCARLIAKEGHSVTWHTPLGLPVVQPYRRKDRQHVRTLLQRLVLVENNDELPVMKQRQRTAFPPNFIHSIDSSHMMLTAIACRQEGERSSRGLERGVCVCVCVWGGGGGKGWLEGSKACQFWPLLAYTHAGPRHHHSTCSGALFPRPQGWTLRVCTTRSGPTPAPWSA
jgi:hypothetical protein